MSYTYKSTVGVSDGVSSITSSSNETGNVKIEFDTNFPASSTNVAQTMSFTIASLQYVHLLSDKGCTIKTNGIGTSEVQSLSITGTPTGGTFALTFSNQVTAPIAYNAAASAVQTALRALAAIGSTGVNCTGGPLPGTAVVITFAGPLANTNVAAIVPDNGGGLTGGTTPAVAIAVTTPGLPSDVITLVAGVAYSWRKSAGYNACLFTVDVTSAFVSCTPASRLQAKILTS